MTPFCRFLASLWLKYDVTDAILQGTENESAISQESLFDLFEILQAVRVNKGILLVFKVRYYGNSNENN